MFMTGNIRYHFPILAGVPSCEFYAARFRVDRLLCLWTTATEAAGLPDRLLVRCDWDGTSNGGINFPRQRLSAIDACNPIYDSCLDDIAG